MLPVVSHFEKSDLLNGALRRIYNCRVLNWSGADLNGSFISKPFGKPNFAFCDRLTDQIWQWLNPPMQSGRVCCVDIDSDLLIEKKIERLAKEHVFNPQ